MLIISDDQAFTLIQNGQENKNLGENHPVIFLYQPCTGNSFLLSEVLSSNPDFAYALCDYNYTDGPVCDYVDLRVLELTAFSVPDFVPKNYPISAYAKAAKKMGCITNISYLLDEALTM